MFHFVYTRVPSLFVHPILASLIPMRTVNIHVVDNWCNIARLPGGRGRLDQQYSIPSRRTDDLTMSLRRSLLFLIAPLLFVQIAGE